MNAFRLISLVVFVILFGQTACFEPQDGCLDEGASNFYPAADNDCCCRYPNLVLAVDQVYDTLLYRQDSLFPGLGGHLFRIKSIVFYLSDFQLFKNGVLYEMGDSTDFKTYDALQNDTITQNLTDDFTLIRRTPIDNPVAAIREDGTFDQIRFRLGLNPEAQTIIPALAPVSHPLYLQKENLYDDGYVFLQAVVVRDSDPATAPDTLNFYQNDLPNFNLEGNGAFTHELGLSFKVNLSADWAKLFEGVDWINGDISAWKSQIVVNLPSVFTVSQ